MAKKLAKKLGRPPIMGDSKMLTPGGEIQMTQGAIPLSELIAKFMFGGTSSGSK